MMPVINIGGGRQTGRTTRMLESVLDVCGCVGAHQHDEDRILLVSHCFQAAQGHLALLEQMAIARGYKPTRGPWRTLSIGAAAVVFTTPDSREAVGQGAELPSSEFWDHRAVERVHEERLRLKGEVSKLYDEMNDLVAERDSAQIEALTLKLELDDLKKDLYSRKAAE